MPVFNWRDSIIEDDSGSYQRADRQWEALAARYESATGAIGIEHWVEFVAQVRELETGRGDTPEGNTDLWSALNTLVQQIRSKPPICRLTVFVSHQREDAAWAERVAWIANEEHLDYWLDIHDPRLLAANSSALTPIAKSVLVAGIIEMALVNSTHLVSMQTANAKKSRWVPYEFGRAKERHVLASNAASWFEKGVSPSQNTDYLFLSFCAWTSTALEAWLNVVGRTQPPSAKNPWPQNSEPGPLPN